MAQDPSKSTGFMAPTVEELAPLFPAYDIEAFIAQGGMGAVYKARQKSLDRPVAIKILPSEFGADPQFRASFEAEAKAMARLNHPNLIAVYDFGDIGGMLYIVMEFVHGKALYYSSHNKAIDPKVALDIVATVCRGLGHAHRGGIIHRDIKPANILLDTKARPKIGDFGLAHPVDRDKGDALNFGTPGYTAPEVFREGGPVDERSDLFSVGALLYELISGKQPMQDSHSMITGTDPRLDAIIKRATHPDPNLRYASADLLADELEALLPKLSGPQFATAPVAKVPNLTPTLASSNSKSGALSFFLVLLVLVGGGAAAYFALRTDSDQQSASSAPVVTVAPDRKKPAGDRKPPKKDKPDRPTAARDPKPKPEPVSKPPAPKPVTPTGTKETPMQALARLSPALKEGTRSEFPPGTIQTKTSAYFFVPQNMTWDQARDFATSAGAHLAILDSPEKLSWFHEHFQSPKPVWLGASDSGFEKKWSWDNGEAVDDTLWAPGSPDDKTDQSADGEDFLAISAAKPTVDDHSRLEKFPLLLEWFLDGSTPASLDSQLARTAQALNDRRTPVFPSGTYNVGGSRFLLINREVSWEDAQITASNAGGHLAVPSNEGEAAFLALLLNDRLKEGESCWIGGRRSPDTPEIWQYVTGEVFTFVTWLDGQPDNDNENEDRLVLKKNEGKLGGSDENIFGHKTTHFFVEWSVPSRRNMPSASSFEARNSELLEALEEVRDKIRNRYGRDYRKYRKERDEIIEDFLENTITAINNTERLAAPIKARLVEEVKKYLDENRLPETLPRLAPGNLQRDLEEAREELKELDEENKGEYQEAKESYLDELLDTANKLVKEGEEAKAKVMVLENTVTTKDNERFKSILRGDKVPLPEAPPEKEEEKDE